MGRKITKKEKEYLKVFRFLESMWDDPELAKELDALIDRHYKNERQKLNKEVVRLKVS